MSTDQAIVIHDPLAQLEGALAREGHAAVADAPGWLRVTSSDDEAMAKSLSLSLSATVVWWSIHTAVDQVWIQCFDRGAHVRELRYSAAEGWAANEGTPLPFENTLNLARWLERRTLSANPQGYDVIACFVGRSTPPPAADVKDPGATIVLMLPPNLVDEVSVIAARRGVTSSTVIGAAWSLGRKRLRAELSQAGEELPNVAIDGAPALDLAGPAVKCALALTQEAVRELQELMESSDRARSWLVVRAYVLARADVFGRVAEQPASGG